MESVKTNEGELTSTMGNLLSTSKEEKNDATDSTPTSSTDAFTTTSTSQIAADDPISSTSSDASDTKKSTEKVNDLAQSFTNNVMNSNPIMSSLKDISMGDHSSLIVSEKDLLDMNITDTSTEKITENVDDIVQDLENLLGEPTTSFDFTIRPKDAKRNINLSQNKDITMDLDAFSAELQMFEDKPSKVNEEKSQNTSTQINKSSDLHNKLVASVNKEESFSEPAPVSATSVQEETKITHSVNQDVQESANCDIKPSSVEESSIEHEESSQAEVITGSAQEPVEKSESTLVIEKDDNPETLDIISTHSKDDHIEAPPDLIRSENISGDVSCEPDVSQETEKVAEERNFVSSDLPHGEPVQIEEDIEKHVEEQLESTSAQCVMDGETVRQDGDEDYSEKPISQDVEMTLPPPEDKEEDTLPAPQEEKTDTLPLPEEKKESNQKETASNLLPVEMESARSIDEHESQAETISQITNNEVFDSCVAESTSEKQVPEVDNGIKEQSVVAEESQREPEQTEDVEMVVASVDNTLTEFCSAEQKEEPQGHDEETFKHNVAVVDNQEEAEMKDNESKLIDKEKGTEIEGNEENIAVQPEPEMITELTPVVEDSGDCSMQQVPLSVLEDAPREDLINAGSLPEVEDIHIEKQQPPEIDSVKQLVDEVISENSQTEKIMATQDHEDFEENKECSAVAKEEQFEDVSKEQLDCPAVPEVNVGKTEILEEISTESLKEMESAQEDIIENSEGVKRSEENRTVHLDIPVVEAALGDDISNVDSNVGTLSCVLPDVSSMITGNMEIPSHSLAADLDLLVQNTVGDEAISAAPPPVQVPSNFVEGSNVDNIQVPLSSSLDSLKNLETSDLESNMLPLAMGDVPDLDVLNAISTLNDNKTDLIPEISDSLENNDALLGSSTLEQRHQESDTPFEPCMETTLPTVDEIFAEQSQTQSVELQDDNLETLLAVASLQNVDYNIPPVEDFPTEGQIPTVDEISQFGQEESIPPVEFPSFASVMEPPMKIQDAKIESLFEEKRAPVKEQVYDNVKEVGRNETEQITQQQDDKLKEPLLINIDDSDKDRVYSPKITIKPIKPESEEAVTSASGEVDEREGSKGSLKITITKQSDNMHSILKIYDPDNDTSQNQDAQSSPSEPTVPKLIIKPIVQPNEQPQSPKMSTRSSKQVFSPSSSASQRSASPRITIKPIPKPDNIEPVVPKITIKPVLKPDDGHRQKHSPKLTIKPIIKPEEEINPEPKVHSPRVTIKPIVKPPEEVEQVLSPRITIKPIVKPDTVSEPLPTTPRVTIKPVLKPQEKDKEITEQVEKSSPKITIKPIVKPQEAEPPPDEYEESIKERIVLKINKGTIPSSSKESRRREAPQEEEKSEKLAKIKLKFSKEGGHPHIVQDEFHNKRSAEQNEHDKFKRQKMDTENILSGVTITPIGPPHSKLKEMLSRSGCSSDKVVTVEDDDDDVTIVETNKPSPIVISEESNQDSINVAMEVRDPISDIPVFEITPESCKTLNPQPVQPVAEAPPLPAPRKRGRPRKVPLQVREDFKDPKEEEPKPVVESTRPKRSCRGQSVRTTLGIKPRKPRGPGRGRGGKRGMGTRGTPTPPETPPPKAAKEPKLSAGKLKQFKEDLLLSGDKAEVKQIEIDDGFHKSPSQSLLAPPQNDNSTTDRADIVMYEEETRMSAETSSRAQTPAKQVVTTVPSVDLVEESQSSVQSSATTESVKVRKGPRLEVHQEPEGAVISADQLAEYYWSGGGPYMLQEQVAQFLGIKSFKRKYPNIARRVVDMQERDFIRESGLASEAMCDLGLTAVNSSDILDIMYSDFQDKYEEYCKHQRDRQAKDLTNKQKALTLAASQEKTKMDITQQAVQSAASWNATFNKARRDQRKACMDLQTLTVHFPKGRMKQINKPKVGYYPVALVPGQFTDYYGEFTPTELNNLPLNTLCYEPIVKQEMECDSQTDGSGSESETSTSDSDSSYSGSSDAEDCTICKPTPKRVAAAQ